MVMGIYYIYSPPSHKMYISDIPLEWGTLLTTGFIVYLRGCWDIDINLA